MLHAIRLPDTSGQDGPARDEVLDRVERLHLHLTALGHASSTDEVAQIVATAAATVDALLRSERERSEMVEVLAHDLRSPMTALHGFASLLTTRWGDLDEDRRRDLLGMIQKETERMNRMVEDVSTAVLGPTTALPVRIDRVDLGAVADALVVAAQASRPTHSIRCVVVAGAPYAHADGDGVARILGNLLENAVRHTPTGTVVLVHVGRDDHAVAVTVADDGPGVTLEDASCIFDRGVRGADPLGPGSGLGLHTARTLAEAMGGTLELAPSARGATFVLRLPVATLRGV